MRDHHRRAVRRDQGRFCSKARQAIEVFRRVHKAEPIYQATLRGRWRAGADAQTSWWGQPCLTSSTSTRTPSTGLTEPCRVAVPAGGFYGLGREAGIPDPSGVVPCWSSLGRFIRDAGLLRCPQRPGGWLGARA